MNFVECIVFYCDPPSDLSVNGTNYGSVAKVVAARNFWEAKTRPITHEEVMAKSPIKEPGGFFHIFLNMN